MVHYTLTMNQDQAREVRHAVELLLRLKINQPEEITRAVLDQMLEDERIDIDEFCKRRDRASGHLKAAFDELFPHWSEIKKDKEWYRLYNILQVIRYAIHEAEHPNSTGVDSYPPTQFTEDEPLPKCEWVKE